MPLQTWVFPQDRDAGLTLFEETTRQAMAFFTERIGPYSYEKLANVEAAGLSGGTEHASAIFYGEKGVTKGRGPVVHEVAHQWWGNAVTERDWDDVWLSEGFATYFTMLFTEHVHGRDAFVRSLRGSRQTVLETERKLPDTPVIHRNLSDMRRVLNALVYQKAGWVLHMLRGLVGTEAFWKGIREYYRRYRNGNVSTDDFRAVMEEASGTGPSVVLQSVADAARHAGDRRLLALRRRHGSRSTSSCLKPQPAIRSACRSRSASPRGPEIHPEIERVELTPGALDVHRSRRMPSRRRSCSIRTPGCCRRPGRLPGARSAGD